MNFCNKKIIGNTNYIVSNKVLTVKNYAMISVLLGIKFHYHTLKNILGILSSTSQFHNLLTNIFQGHQLMISP